MGGDQQTIQIPWLRVFLAAFIGLPAVGYVYYCMSKPYRRSDVVDGKEEKKKKSVGEETSSAKVGTPEKLNGPALVARLKENGNELFKNNQYRAAIRSYSEAIETCPPPDTTTLAALYQNRAAAFDALGDMEAVITNCTEALNFKPMYLKALIRRYKAYVKLGRLESAMDDVTACVLLQQFSNPEEIAAADQIMRHLGFELATKYDSTRPLVMPKAKFVAEYFGSFASDPISEWLKPTECADTDENLKGLSAAKKAMRDQNYKQVIPFCTDEIDSLKNNEEQFELPIEYYEALLLRGTMYLLVNKDDLARADLKEIIENESVHPKIAVSALLKRASLLVKDCQKDEAMADYDRALKIDPKNADVYQRRGQMLLMDGKFDESLTNLEKAYTLNPSVSVLSHKLLAEYKLGDMKNDQSQKDSAEKGLCKIITDDPLFTEGYEILVSIYNDEEKFQKSDHLLDQGIQADPDNAVLFVRKGTIRILSETDLEGAAKYYEQAITLDPTHDVAYATLASIEVQRGNLPKAINLFKKAIPLQKRLEDLAHVFSMKAAAEAQYRATTRLGINFQTMTP
ncbi:Tetratricopeptide repeat [Nesidiocoris tenuis]|uniref:Tetratricopeptide repeat n=1 Tax=Nesidiocoris tenuis TaxID=355587 RepID=A0ABN7AS61_9HEMI|nr:Tetratricopeptide repeat [Nesidiocoris tenuis]